MVETAAGILGDCLLDGRVDNERIRKFSDHAEIQREAEGWILRILTEHWNAAAETAPNVPDRRPTLGLHIIYDIPRGRKIFDPESRGYVSQP